MATTKAAERSAYLANAFIGKPKPPTDKELIAALGPARLLWGQLLAELASELNLTAREWNTYSPKAGWSLRIKNRDRIIVYLAPLQGCFRASFALSDKAVQAALASGLPGPVIQTIKSAKKYAEGTAVRIDVQRSEDTEAVKKLVEAKLKS